MKTKFVITFYGVFSETDNPKESVVGKFVTWKRVNSSFDYQYAVSQIHSLADELRKQIPFCDCYSVEAF